jgi:putative molybdopterin biosynthesis protein
MAEIKYIKALEQIKIMADARRLAILRMLMAQPATLTQLGRALGEHPAWIRHHLKQLEQAGLVEMTTEQVSGGFVEKYYRAKARAYIFQEIILPDFASQDTLVLMGSHDLALDLLARRLQEDDRLNILTLPVGSLEGLMALRQGFTHLTGCHLLDSQSLEYNLPYVRHFFPDRQVSLVTLAERRQGLLVKEGNSKQIRDLADLARKGVTLINRNRGSGTRLWLDRQLGLLGIPGAQVRGYRIEARTHIEVAEAILLGRADAGIGLEAAARQFGLDFVPLYQERFDLVLPEEELHEETFQPLLDYLQSAEFRGAVERLGGYDTTQTGNLLTP